MQTCNEKEGGAGGDVGCLQGVTVLVIASHDNPGGQDAAPHDCIHERQDSEHFPPVPVDGPPPDLME